VIFEYANNAHTTLAGSIGSTDTTLTVATSSGALFPPLTTGQAFYCTLLDAATQLIIEIVKVTARAGDVFTIVRAQQGTGVIPDVQGYAYVAGSIVTQLITAGDLDNFVQSAQLPSFGTTTYPVTFNNSNAGAASGTTFDGSVARTISANTLGALQSVAFTGSNQSLVTNGYQSFPGGLILQWGSVSSLGQIVYASVNQPLNINFPTATLAVYLTPTCADTYSAIYGIGTANKSGFAITKWDRFSFNWFYATATNIQGFTWFAVGY